MQNELIKKDPKNMIALNNIGRAYLDLKENKKDKKNKNFHEALKYFEKMIVIDEFSVEALFNIATVYDKLSNEKKAEEYYRRVLNIDPSYRDANLNLSLILLRNGHFSEGLQSMKPSFNG